MMSLWWLGLALLALPLWWHRQRRQRVREDTLATARFLPSASPQQLRVWRIREPLLLLVRCLLLTAVLAWLADLVLPWRGDTVLIAAGSDGAWVDRQIKLAGFEDAGGAALPPGDGFAWLAQHAREWRGQSRLLILGDVPMPAVQPRSRHQLLVRAAPRPVPASEVQVAVVSQHPERWQAFFGAIDGPRRYRVAAAANPALDLRPELIVWDLPEAPPAGMRAPLWWVADASAFPELVNAREVDGIRYLDTARGRLWVSAAGTWPPQDAAAARALFETWQRLHYPPQPYSTATQTIAPTPGAREGSSSGALHYTLALVLLGLFALERMMTHARRR